jgi:hypothetical protein
MRHGGGGGMVVQPHSRNDADAIEVNERNMIAV